MPKTIKLVGVLHYSNLCQDYAEWILDNYPKEKKIMVELPPSEKDAKYVDFFSSLESLLKQNHRKVIRGDTGRRITQKHLEVQRLWEEVDYAIESKKPLPPHYLSTTIKYLGGGLKEVALSGKRNKEFLKNTILYEPDLVVLGSAHTDYLRKHLPSTHYVRFEDGFLRPPRIIRPKPDVQIKIMDIEDYALDKLL